MKKKKVKQQKKNKVSYLKHQKLAKLIAEKEIYYEKLVWYARSPVKAAIRKILRNTPEEIIQGALNSQAMIEELYPEEVSLLKGEGGEFTHGFNSGMLAALRYISTAHQTTLMEDEGEEFEYGGVEMANMEFPDLST